MIWDKLCWIYGLRPLQIACNGQWPTSARCLVAIIRIRGAIVNIESTMPNTILTVNQNRKKPSMIGWNSKECHMMKVRIRLCTFFSAFMILAKSRQNSKFDKNDNIFHHQIPHSIQKCNHMNVHVAMTGLWKICGGNKCFWNVKSRYFFHENRNSVKMGVKRDFWICRYHELIRERAFVECIYFSKDLLLTNPISCNYFYCFQFNISP